MKIIILPNTIGNTPIVELPIKISSHIRIYAKLESKNMSGSIKDRPAYYMFTNAENRKLINKEKVLLESSSGNTAIGLAAISAIKKYKFIAVVGQNILEDKVNLLKYYGADIIKVPNGENLRIARQMVKEQPNKYQMLDQYRNKLNYISHYYSTAEEIISDLPNVTHVVVGMGTGGTIMGLSLRLKRFNPKIQIIGIEPAVDIHVQGLRNYTKFVPEIYSPKRLDQHLVLHDERASMNLVRELGKKYGISAGISSGAALWGALEVAKKIKKGKILAIFPDGIEKYLGMEELNS